jgi:hypothetical protein
MTSTYSEAG